MSDVVFRECVAGVAARLEYFREKKMGAIQKYT